MNTMLKIESSLPMFIFEVKRFYFFRLWFQFFYDFVFLKVSQWTHRWKRLEEFWELFHKILRFGYCTLHVYESLRSSYLFKIFLFYYWFYGHGFSFANQVCNHLLSWWEWEAHRLHIIHLKSFDFNFVNKDIISFLLLKPKGLF